MLVTVKVTPRAHKNTLTYEKGLLKVRLHAIPEKGEANEELIDFLADQLGFSKSSIRIIRGHHSRTKHLRIDGLQESQLLKFSKNE